VQHQQHERNVRLRLDMGSLTGIEQFAKYWHCQITNVRQRIKLNQPAFVIFIRDSSIPANSPIEMNQLSIRQTTR
jgi:hypothetical protein